MTMDTLDSLGDYCKQEGEKHKGLVLWQFVAQDHLETGGASKALWEEFIRRMESLFADAVSVLAQRFWNEWRGENPTIEEESGGRERDMGEEQLHQFYKEIFAHGYADGLTADNFDEVLDTTIRGRRETIRTYSEMTARLEELGRIGEYLSGKLSGLRMRKADRGDDKED